MALVVIATVTASAAVAAAAASKIKEYYVVAKRKTRVKGCRFSISFRTFNFET
jgi:hypothetical protein